MNKKFSTLLAGVALFGATSAFAGNNVPSLIEGTNDGLYQLKTPGNLYLAVNPKGELVTVDNVTADNVASTLWCTTVTVENQGKAPIYDFVNKGAEALLSVTMDDFAKNAMQTTKNSLVGGEIAGWAFSGTYANALETNRPLYSYFQEDSVVGLVLEGTNVRLKKAGGKATDISGAKFATFTLVEADGIALNAKQINTKLGIQDAANGVKLTFNPDRNNTSLENPFSDVAFIAKDTKDGSFVYVTRKADNQYLHVDTAYTNKNSDKFLAFNYKKTLSKDLADQGKFLFTYFPSHDSLVIQVKQATRLSASVKDWKQALTTAGNKTIIANASSAVDTYVTTATALYQELNTLITTLTTSNFQGDAADGFKEFFNNKATPILVDSLTAPNTSLTAGIKTMLDNISTSLLDQVDVQLGEGNRTAGDASAAESAAKI